MRIRRELNEFLQGATEWPSYRISSEPAAKSCATK